MAEAPVVAEIRQVRQATFTHITTIDPVIIWVQRGSKHVDANGISGHIRHGDIGILPAQHRLTIENIPDDKGEYLATALSFPNRLLRAVDDNPPTGSHRISCSMDDDLQGALTRILQAIAGNNDSVPVTIVEQRVVELLLWLKHRGVNFPTPQMPQLADKLRQKIAQDLSHDWKAAALASEFGMSEATLRRKLMDEGTSFRETLSDTRLTQALSMIQSTSWNIARIAAEVGYLSPSRFSARFVARFGIKPSSLRDR